MALQKYNVQDFFALDVKIFCPHGAGMNSKARKMIAEYLANEERSASWLARKCGVAPSTVTRWLTGEVTPSMKTRQNLANMTGLNVANEGDWDVGS